MFPCMVLILMKVLTVTMVRICLTSLDHIEDPLAREGVQYNLNLWMRILGAKFSLYVLNVKFLYQIEIQFPSHSNPKVLGIGPNVVTTSYLLYVEHKY